MGKKECEICTDIEFTGCNNANNSLSLDDILYLQDLNNRKMYITYEIDMECVQGVIRNIIRINEEDSGIDIDKRKPIKLYISSYGGEVSAGMALIDAIILSKTPVYTINIGNEYSMAFLIGIAGHKRFATRNSTFLTHDGAMTMCDSLSKVRDQMEFNKKFEDRIKKFVTGRTNISDKEYEKKYRVDWYMFADEAKEKGVVDYIIGEDCGIEEIM